MKQADPSKRITGADTGGRWYPHSIAYHRPRCGTATGFPQPRAGQENSYVAADIRQMFDLETAAKQLYGETVDIYCQGCLFPVRVIFSHDSSGDRGEWWTVKAVLEYEPV